MTKRHFEAAARIVRDTLCTDDERRVMAMAFEALFREFNPRFDVVRFHKACGL